MKTIRTLAITLVVALFGTSAHADDKKPDACTPTVKAAVFKAFPDATIDKCKAEKEHGQAIVEVKLTRKDGSRIELDVGLDGKILQTEEKISVDKVPPAVMKAFAARYPKAKASAAEKQSAEKSTSYEIAFLVDGAKKEATFTEDGKFVEEE
jgi:hypothetical protein